MKKILIFLTTFSFLFVISSFSSIHAVYKVTFFDAQIEVHQNKKISITEAIEVFFEEPRHGIFRVVPINYLRNGRTIASRLKLGSVTDEAGNNIPVEVSRVGQSLEFKIGDPDEYVSGRKKYVIKYEASNILQKYDGGYELYWNVTGHEWDTEITKSSALIKSPYAKIIRTNCFSGVVGANIPCAINNVGAEGHEVNFSANRITAGEDFTIVVEFDEESAFAEPTYIQSIIESLYSNWGYGVSVLPFLTLFFFWYKKGRDLKFVGDNVYYKPENAKVETKSVFEREHLPLVYYPINGYTPSQIGTIIDEKVDIHDVVSEIVELARLGKLKIEKTETKKFLGKKIDYKFTKVNDTFIELNGYQEFLLEKMFAGKDEVMLSALKNKFYLHLESFKKKLYESLKAVGVFEGNPESTRALWVVTSIFLVIFSFIVIMNFGEQTGNFWPLLPFLIFLIPTFFVANKMPRRTPLGYMIYRQTVGLARYLKVGRWRQEINEKRLFFEEMLPLAISLEVVKKLAKDMEILGIRPPSYFAGTTAHSLSSDLVAFRNTAASTFVSAPSGKFSGSSSWSGGSGFSGGSSGGGFGGGGGGSW